MKDKVRVSFSENKIKELNQKIYRYVKNDVSEIELEVETHSGVFPNVCLPIAGILAFYKENYGICFRGGESLSISDEYIAKTMFWDPYIVEEAGQVKLDYPFDRVWRFNTPEGVAKITDAFIAKVRTSDCVGKGVLQSIEWCINETLDNVLQHANSNGVGFIMGQLHQQKHRLAIAVFDYGRGILASFQESNYKPCPRTSLDAISLALQEKTTRDKTVGQGNGMWGLAQLVQNNGGQLQVCSGGSGITYHGVNQPTQSRNELSLGARHGTTLVDFQLDYGKSIDIDQILGCGRANLWLEEHEEDNGQLKFVVAQECDGTGTRQAAIRFRNLILNAYKEYPHKIILDFSDIRFVSSSFADELIGKLVLQFGFLNFIRIFDICNVDKTCITTINRSVFQRLAHEYYDEEIVDPEN